ncbi:hypothetical protein ABVF67_003177 [Vibrio parahaemolyticus]|nr:hypothetical protein [Vibrio alginolyticus]MBE5149439.1 hypothetical protein [Vibrio parahaemolyticus]MDF4719792.1 hypothetical protein [Vibrio parahaemolyticus]
MKLEEAVLAHVSSTVLEISQSFSIQDDYVVIGGIALYCHMTDKGYEPIKDTKDADITCGCYCFGALREMHEVTFNNRLKKHEYKVSLSVNGNDETVDVDVYVCFSHGLKVDGTELIQHAIVVKDILCAHPLHLLVLKIDTYIDFDGDRECDKFVKIVHDVLQFLALIQIEDQVTSTLAQVNFDQTRLSTLTGIIEKHNSVVAAVLTTFKKVTFDPEIAFLTESISA